MYYFDKDPQKDKWESLCREYTYMSTNAESEIEKFAKKKALDKIEEQKLDSQFLLKLKEMEK